jgi:hypothetical protein
MAVDSLQRLNPDLVPLAAHAYAFSAPKYQYRLQPSIGKRATS